MEGYTFVDIFATKGIEYIVVIVFLVLFVFFIRNLASRSEDSGPPTGGK